MINGKNAGARIRFIFAYCNDLAAVRGFYTDLLGLREKSFNEEHGWLCYRSENVELMFFRSANAPVQERWAVQPGYAGGEVEVMSLGIEVPEEAFAPTVERLKASGVRAFSADAEWRQDSYWGFTVMDPMGMTVEVYAVPTKK